MKMYEIVNKDTNKVIATAENKDNAFSIKNLFSSYCHCYVREVEVKDEPKKKYEVVIKNTNKVIDTVDNKADAVTLMKKVVFSTSYGCFIREVEVKDEPKKKYILNITFREKSLENEKFPPILTNTVVFDTFEEAKANLLENYNFYKVLSMFIEADVKYTEIDEARGNLLMTRGINCTDGEFFVGSITEM